MLKLLFSLAYVYTDGSYSNSSVPWHVYSIHLSQDLVLLKLLFGLEILEKEMSSQKAVVIGYIANRKKARFTHCIEKME